jgi:hypothetical protein
MRSNNFEGNLDFLFSNSRNQFIHRVPLYIKNYSGQKPIDCVFFDILYVMQNNKFLLWVVIGGIILASAVIMVGYFMTRTVNEFTIEPVIAPHSSLVSTSETASTSMTLSQFKVWKTIELGGIQTANKFHNTFQVLGIQLDGPSNEILNSKVFPISGSIKRIDLVNVSTEELGLASSTSREEIIAKALSLGLKLCPPEVGFQLRLQYRDQPNDESLIIATEPFAYSGTDPFMFYITKAEGNPWILFGRTSKGPDGYQDGSLRWIFARNNSDTQAGQKVEMNASASIHKFDTWKTVELGTGTKTAAEFRNSLENSGMKINDGASQMLDSAYFTVSEKAKSVNLVNPTVEELGLSTGASRKDIIAKAISLGLELCPPEVGPQLRLQYKDQGYDNLLFIAMEPIMVKPGLSFVFAVVAGGGYALDAVSGHPDSSYLGISRFVFVLPK